MVNGSTVLKVTACQTLLVGPLCIYRDGDRSPKHLFPIKSSKSISFINYLFRLLARFPSLRCLVFIGEGRRALLAQISCAEYFIRDVNAFDMVNDFRRYDLNEKDDYCR